MKLPWPTWTKRRWYVVVFLVALIVLPALVYRWDGNAASIVIYWLTALIVLAYTYETYCMRLEMVRQNEITIQPLLITSIEHRPEPGTGAAGRIEVLIIRNLGRGAALFIRVADIEITLEHTQESPLLARRNVSTTLRHRGHAFTVEPQT
jgi:hypothetical protein